MFCYGKQVTKYGLVTGLKQSIFLHFTEIVLFPVVVDCGELPAPNNGLVIPSGAVFGSEATYVCDPGFSSHGIDIRVCQDDGTWSGEPLICLEKGMCA